MSISFRRAIYALLLAVIAAAPGAAQEGSNIKKIFVVTDLEGVSGVFDTDLQCLPFKSPRFEEARKLLTGEVNAAAEGLFDGGASEIVVWDGHDSGQTLSVLEVNPRVRLLTGVPVSPTLELDASYAAVVFIGQHAMAGAERAILSHSYSSQGIQNIWVNDRSVGEIGARVMLAGALGVPVIMLSGDAAACRELHELVPQAECAEVKQGVSRTAGIMLPHAAACALIREKARRAMLRLAEFEPYRLGGPVEVKVEFTPRGTRSFPLREGIERLNDRTWVFRGKDIVDAWLNYSSF